jgi:predicted cobalt transporter CbtA
MTGSGKLIRFSIPDIVDSPLQYPLTLDSAGERVLLIRMSEADYRVASFLDNRVMNPGMHGVWIPLREIAIASRQVKPRPLHFIFHAGHVGSTLLSRLLDELPGVLGLREPMPLRTLADDYDQLGLAGLDQFNVRLATFLNLWSRGFKDTRTVIVKSTSIASRVAPLVLGMAKNSRAVYLNVKLETYLATLLAAAHDDIAAFASSRAARLGAILGTAPPQAHSKGEAIAVAWLTEQFTQQTAQKAAGDRVLAIDFDEMLADLPQTLARCTAHFGLKAGPNAIARLAKSPILSRYSKAPERQAFSPETRTAILQATLRDHAAEIEKATRFVSRLSERHKEVASLAG